MIADVDIRGADPAAVIQQFEPYLQKIAERYTSVLARTGAVDMDDLIQVGRIAIADAQQKYNPESGSFIGYLFYAVRSAMRREVGINQNGAAPAALAYLDEPLSDDEDITLGDTVQDPAAVPMDETIIDDENRRETAEQIRAALDRMKSDKQKTAVKLVWMEGKSRKAAAAEMEMKPSAFYALEKAGRSTLRRDHRLRKHAEEMPFIHVSVSRFNTTWTSATEHLALWRLEHLKQPPDITNESKAERDNKIMEIWNREHATK